MERISHRQEDHHRERMALAWTTEQQQCHRAFKTSTYEQYKNINPSRAVDTCRWILDNPQYQNWHESSHNDLLWISADPGCGKSVLAKSLIDIDLKSESVCICYFFFKDNEEQNNLATALCAVLHQLFEKQPGLLGHALPAWEQNGTKLQHEVESLWRILEAAISDSAFYSTICIMDALDECQRHGQIQLIEMLQNFYSRSRLVQRHSWLKFLITSRPYSEIQEDFREATKSFPHIHVCGEKMNEQIHTEINSVVKSRVADLAESEGLSETTRQRLEDQLLRMEHRTYLWLQLAIDDIRAMFRNSLTPDEELVQLIPKSVTSAYEKILNRVPPSNVSNVKLILQIVVGARRPLTIEELAMAFGIAKSAKSEVKAQVLRDKICHLCGLFVFINSSDRVFFDSSDSARVSS